MYLVLYSAKWCGQCKRVLLSLKRLVGSQYRHINHLTVYDHDEDPVIFNAEKIGMIPEVHLRDALDRDFFLSCGYVDYETLKMKIDNAIEHQGALET